VTLIRTPLDPIFSATLSRHPQRETREKQVAMITQKVMDANHTQYPGRGLIPFPNQRTTALRALLSDHWHLFFAILIRLSILIFTVFLCPQPRLQ
jgi:hypothetical protein